MKLSLGPKDPRSAKAAAALSKERAQIEAIKLRAKNYIAPPMPEWAVEEALREGKRDYARGFQQATGWAQWPLARKAYLSCF